MRSVEGERIMKRDQEPCHRDKLRIPFQRQMGRGRFFNRVLTKENEKKSSISSAQARAEGAAAETHAVPTPRRLAGQARRWRTPSDSTGTLRRAGFRGEFALRGAAGLKGVLREDGGGQETRGRKRKCGSCGSAEQAFLPLPPSLPANTWTIIKLKLVLGFDGHPVARRNWMKLPWRFWIRVAWPVKRRSPV